MNWVVSAADRSEMVPDLTESLSRLGEVQKSFLTIASTAGTFQRLLARLGVVATVPTIRALAPGTRAVSRSVPPVPVPS